MRELFESTIERLLGDLVTPDLVHASEAGQWPAELWAAIEESGFALATAPESAGGAGASWDDAFVILLAAGRHSAPLPLPETILANALLGRCGLEAMNVPLSFSATSTLDLADGLLSGLLTDVPWGRHVKHVIALTTGAQPSLALLDATQAVVTPRLNTAGEPRDDLRFDAVAPLEIAVLPAVLSPDSLLLGAALIRSVQIAGALQNVLEQTTRYATERVQFGKPIGSFQAIQHQIALLAEQTAAASVAAEAACAESDGGFAALRIATAKIATADAASAGAAIAHTVHGAIGFTHEYALHLSTRRLWSWRSEFGSLTTWAQIVGRAACAGGAAALWPAITAGTMPLVIDGARS